MDSFGFSIIMFHGMRMLEKAKSSHNIKPVEHKYP